MPPSKNQLKKQKKADSQQSTMGQVTSLAAPSPAPAMAEPALPDMISDATTTSIAVTTSSQPSAMPLAHSGCGFPDVFPASTDCDRCPKLIQLYNGMHTELHSQGTQHTLVLEQMQKSMEDKNAKISSLEQGIKEFGEFKEKARHEFEGFKGKAREEKKKAVAARAILEERDKELEVLKAELARAKARQEREDGEAEVELDKVYASLGGVLKKHYKDKRQKKMDAKERMEKEEMAKKAKK